MDQLQCFTRCFNHTEDDNYDDSFPTIFLDWYVEHSEIYIDTPGLTTTIEIPLLHYDATFEQLKIYMTFL